jgi:hypothetical protein
VFICSLSLRNIYAGGQSVVLGSLSVMEWFVWAITLGGLHRRLIFYCSYYLSIPLGGTHQLQALASIVHIVSSLTVPGNHIPMIYHCKLIQYAQDSFYRKSALRQMWESPKTSWMTLSGLAWLCPQERSKCWPQFWLSHILMWTRSGEPAGWVNELSKEASFRSNQRSFLRSLKIRRKATYWFNLIRPLDKKHRAGSTSLTLAHNRMTELRAQWCRHKEHT